MTETPKTPGRQYDQFHAMEESLVQIDQTLSNMRRYEYHAPERAAGGDGSVSYDPKAVEDMHAAHDAVKLVLADLAEMRAARALRASFGDQNETKKKRPETALPA